ncbi:Major facilitator superfamily (MFS) transport protein [Arcticibacter svalbardensis MN12-7]|uniref:Major facilitator superfamily (MFS) transport protein n=1 Tax=Arcticibacter svalbardensis MN12-7 TaxID=1150600 RepID=R9GM73_9SPHI|nr:MFS transporter [Arcticibacter svalbardensis]EOR92937.1 Major facilitator superfamily (MFS) transport protein [Arcticibacter svalbardensis MN12-7]
MNSNLAIPKNNILFLVIVAALGYFVDIYDLVIFSIVRVQSFRDIGIPEADMRLDGEYVLNMQMGGLLLGGLLWGIIGDKYGRVKVLFGSIFLYSLANMANGLVHDMNTYAIIRFIAGIGLAGELGAGITLVSESMHKDKRGYGTMMVAGVGVLGAIAAFYVAEHFNWRNAYFVGGAIGLVLLILRVGTFESGLFKTTATQQIKKGNFSMLFASRERFMRYLYCLLIGLPIWFVVGIFVTQAPEFGKALGATDALSAGKGILFTYIGISLGDILAGLIAQLTKSRKLAVFIFQILIVTSSVCYLSSKGITAQQFQWLAFFMGLSVGYWATFVTISSEQFGTNLRATVTTTAPNFVRGALIPSTFIFEFFVHRYNIITAGYIMIFLLTAIAIFALTQLKESFNKDLDYLEM